MYRLQTIRNNPIFIYGLKNRSRNWRYMAAIGLLLLSYAPASLTIAYTGLMSLAGGVYMALLLPEEFLTLFTYENVITFAFEIVPGVALFIFYSSTLFAMFLLTLFAPTLSASTISGERQRQTLEVLQITLLRPHQIIMGKYSSSIIYGIPIVLGLLPLFLLCMLFGGPNPLEVIIVFLMLLCTTFAFTAIGLFASTLAKTITTSLIFIYGLILPALFIAPPLLMLTLSIISEIVNLETELQAIINLLGWGLVSSLNPLSAGLFSTIIYYNEEGLFYIFSPELNLSLPLPWIIYLTLYFILTGLFIKLSVWRLKRL